MSYEKLTELQKIAVKGQVSAILSFAKANADLECRIYRMLKEADPEYKEAYLGAIKETVSLSEEEIMKLFFMGSLGEVPVSLWVEKTIDDIKYYLKVPETSFRSPKLALDKKQERINIIKSTFINFGRKVVMTSPKAMMELIDKIQEDSELEFLHSSCVYLRGGCFEIMNFKCYNDEKIPESILKLEFDPYDIMTIGTETECLNNMDDADSSCSEAPKKERPSSPKVIKIAQINLGNEEQHLSQEELSQFLGQQVMELFNSIHPINLNEHNHSSNSSGTGRLTYVVQKKYKNTDIKEDIRQCDSEKEAREFIDKIYKMKPEINDETFDFIICKKIIEE